MLDRSSGHKYFTDISVRPWPCTVVIFEIVLLEQLQLSILTLRASIPVCTLDSPFLDSTVHPMRYVATVTSLWCVTYAVQYSGARVQ